MIKHSVFNYSLIALFFILNIALCGKEFTVSSPNKKLDLKISITDKVTYSVIKNGYTIIEPSQISLTLESGLTLGKLPKLKNDKIRNINKTLKPIVKQKYETIIDNFNELTLEFAGNYSIIFRVYDDGAAYRFKTSFKDKIIIRSEQAEFNFGKDYKMLFPEEESFMSHSERMYLPIKISEVKSKRFCSLPALAELDDNIKAVITEADLEDYPGMYLTGTDNNPQQLVGLFPAYASKDSARNDRDIYVTERKDYLASTSGKRDFPWRVIVVSEKDGDLIESTMVYKLAKPSDPKMDFSWIKPGKVAWDWYNYNNVIGVDFRAGINTETYKHYIDFASKYGIEYVILDEGWYKLGDLFDINPEINLEELISYAKEKNVEIILWVIWKTLDDQLNEAMDMFEKLGVKGIKVDFMQRDDQAIVNYYYKIAHEAAKRKLLVDFHGSYKPTGLYRTYPNVLTSEGVIGLEHNKWEGENASPWMAVTIPFIRMLAGPLDYTPGAMINGTKENYRYIFNQPMSQGTRCHQLAMYVNFESPLQMLADSPSNYYKESECMEFLSQVPVVWDETKVLDAKLSEYVLTARRNGSKWYVGAMTNGSPRELTVDFSFLPDGEFTIDIWQDGINADRNANDYKKISQKINKNTKLYVQLAPGGGWVGVVK